MQVRRLVQSARCEFYQNGDSKDMPQDMAQFIHLFYLHTSCVFIPQRLKFDNTPNRLRKHYIDPLTPMSGYYRVVYLSHIDLFSCCRVYIYKGRSIRVQIDDMIDFRKCKTRISASEIYIFLYI